MHYIGVIASFMRTFREQKQSETVYKERTEIVLLSVAPMESIGRRRHYQDEDDNADNDDDQ
jgi:hypothetical protein